ncbi:MAG: hypothetical protein RIB98_07505 [Acidimicrobiales bacterium]
MESATDLDDLAENEQVLGFLLAIHGGVHLIGAVMSWRLFEVRRFVYEDLWPTPGTAPGYLAGVIWGLAAVWVGVAGIRLAARRPVSRAQVAGGLTLSLAITSTSVPATLPGATISAAMLLAMGVLALRRRRVSRR